MAAPHPYPWHYTDVPGLGTVLISPYVMERLEDEDITDQELTDALQHGSDIQARTDHSVLGREYRDIRLVIKTYSTEGAAAVCVNGYRVKPDG